MRPFAHPLIAGAALLALALPLSPAAAWADSPGQITVTGEGRVDAAPDIASFSIGVTTEGRSAAEAMAANSAEMDRVIARISGAGVEARDIQTSGLSLNPNWSGSYSVSGENRITGYVAANMVTVRVRDLGALGGVLDAAITDGANSLNGVQFGLADPAPALDEARKRAVADARARAETLAAAAGVTLGRIVSISESQGYGGPQPMFRADTAMAEAVPVAGGEVSTGVNATIVWEIKQ